MVPRARRPTRRPLADESPHPCGAGRGEEGGEGRRPGVGTRRARARACAVRAGGAGGPSGRSVGGPPRWGGEREGGVARKGGGSGRQGRLRASPRRARPSAPLATRLPPRGDAVPTSRDGRPTPTPATPRTRERRGALPARLSPARPPRHVVPSRSGSEEEEGSGAWPGPASHARLRPRCRSRPTPFATAPHPARSLRCVSGWVARRWRGGGGSPWGGRPPARPPVAFPPPALGRFPAGRSWVLRSVPSAPSAGASLPVSRAPGPRLPPSSVRLSLALALSFAPSLPVRPLPALATRFPSELPLRPRWRQGVPRERGRGPG